MIRRLTLILGLLVLLVLAVAWRYDTGKAVGVEFPRGWAAVGAYNGRLILGTRWGPVKPDQQWRIGITGVMLQPTIIVSAERGGDHLFAVRVPIWPVMLAVTALLVWRALARRRVAAGFPVEERTAPADGGTR